MLLWSTHKHPTVRRLSSEGSRRRLPWAMAIPALKKNPARIIPILENLKNDPSESVRREFRLRVTLGLGQNHVFHCQGD